MRLFFLRHGLADRSAWDGPDNERPLTERGIRRMRREAERIHALNLKLDSILSSPLTRAMQTAEIVASRLGLEDHLREDERLAFGFGVEPLAAILSEAGPDQRIMLVGHEPSFSTTVGRITGGGNIVFKKGALARVDLAGLNPPLGELVWLIPPKALVV